MNIANWKMTIEIVDIPDKHGDYRLSIAMLIYQRVPEVFCGTLLYTISKANI